jgi:hypothetical protein
MECYTIRVVDAAGDVCCPKCGAHYPGLGGLGIFSADHDQPMCRSCGKKCAPTMIALLDLARAAERVGKRCRRLLTPPMESLLDLAHAAETFTSSARVTPRVRQDAA